METITTIYDKEWEEIEVSIELSEELKSSIDIISKFNTNIINDSTLLEDMIGENTTVECVKKYVTLKMLAERYAELISACQKLHEAICREIGCKLGFSDEDIYITTPELCRKYNKYIHILLDLDDPLCSQHGIANYRFAERICEMLPYHKRAAEEYIERQKQERRALKEAETLLASIEDADHPSTSDVPENSLPEDDDPTDNKKPTIVSREVALYMLIEKLQGAGIIPRNNIDGTNIGRFIAAIIGEDAPKGIRYTTAYRRVVSTRGNVSTKSTAEAKKYLKLLKIDD